MYMNNGCHGSENDRVPDMCGNTGGNCGRPHYEDCTRPHYVDCAPNGGCDDCRPCPLPPPIKPICVVPGMNTNEQMCHVINRTNECIQRWNSIQEDCYAALNKCIGAAQMNGVYYDCKDVKLVKGYSENDNCPYSYVRIRAVDQAGKPIYISLKPAYGNAGNNGSRQNMQDASFIYSANAIITAIDPQNSMWYGPAMIDGCQTDAPVLDDTAPAGSVLYGFNRGGVLMCFGPETRIETLKQCRMVNVLGPGIQIIQDGEITETAKTLITASTIQAVGYKAACGEKVFFSCGIEEDRGMQGVNVAGVLKDMGCTTAVITCMMTSYPKTSGMPYQGWEGKASAGAAVQEKMGLTGGAMFLGRQLNAPLNWQMPHNQAFWVVSRKPSRGFKNDFTTEIADCTQSMGMVSNSMDNIQNGLDSVRADVDEAIEIARDAADTVATFDDRITDVENGLKEVQSEFQGVKDQVTALDTALTEEINNRVSGDAELSSRINNLTTTVTGINDRLVKEITDRTNDVATLTQAITNEANARLAGDTALDTKIDGEVNKLNEKIANIEAGSYTAGEGISISDSNVISVDRTVVPTVADVESIRASVDAIPHYVPGDNISFTDNEGEVTISANVPGLTELENKVQTNTDNITQAQTDIAGLQESVKNTNISAGNGIAITKVDDTKQIAVKIDNTLSFQPDGSLHVDAPAPAEGEKVTAGEGILIEKNEGVATISVDSSSVALKEDLNGYLPLTGGALTGDVINDKNFVAKKALSFTTNTSPQGNITAFGFNKLNSMVSAGGVADSTTFDNPVRVKNVDTPVDGTDVANKDYVDAAKTELQANIDVIDEAQTELQKQMTELEDGTIPLPYVKKSGDTMSGDLTVQSATAERAVTGGVIIGGTQFPSETFNNGGKAGTISYSGGDVSTLNIHGDVDQIALASGSEVDNTVRVSGVKDGQEGKDAVNKGQLDAVSERVATNSTNIANVQNTVNNIQSGTTELNYVKKTGDSMSGPLSLVDASGNVMGQVELTANGMMLLGGPATDGGHITINQTGVSVDKPLAVQGSVTATDAVSGKQLVTLDQLNAKPTGITQEQADVRYITQANGAATTAITYNTPTDPDGWGMIAKANGIKQFHFGPEGIYSNNRTATHVGVLPIPINIGEPLYGSQAATKNYADTKLPLSGGTMSGAILFHNNSDTIRMNGANAIGFHKGDNYASIYFIDNVDHAAYTPLRVKGVANPVQPNEAANKAYVDGLISSEFSTVSATLTTRAGRTYTSHANIYTTKLGGVYWKFVYSAWNMEETLQPGTYVFTINLNGATLSYCNFSLVDSGTGPAGYMPSFASATTNAGNTRLQFNVECTVTSNVSMLTLSGMGA